MTPRLLSLSLLLTTLFPLPSQADSPIRCTSVIVGKDVTADGSVLLGHNEDLGDHAAQHYIVVPAEDPMPGAVDHLYGGTAVPRPSHTYGYVASTIFEVGYIPGDVTGGINDQGLMVANNLAYRRDAPWLPEIDDRVLWSEFTRLALGHAATADEAVTVVGDLVETFGLGLDSGTMIAVADSHEGWWIEIAYGGQWVAQRVPDDGVVVRANTFRIGEVDFGDTDNFRWSPDLVDFAGDMGWYVGGPFVFSEVYGDPTVLNAGWNTHREDRVNNVLGAAVPAVTPWDVIGLWRDHYEGTALDETDGYTLGPPHQTGQYCLCDMTTEVSSVCQSRDGAPADLLGLCWRAMATPCSSVYVPWWAGHTEMPAVYQTGAAVHTDDSAYWAFRELSEAVEPRYAEVIHDLQGFWSQIEDLEAAELAATETAASDLYDTDPDAAKQLLTDSSNAWAELVYDYAMELLDNDLDVDALQLPGDDDDDSAGDDDDTTADDDDATGNGPPGDGDEDEGGCGCRADGGRGPGTWFAILLGVWASSRFAWRAGRRRRAGTAGAPPTDR